MCFWLLNKRRLHVHIEWRADHNYCPDSALSWRESVDLTRVQGKPSQQMDMAVVSFAFLRYTVHT